MNISHRILDWDTNVFGYRVANIEICGDNPQGLEFLIERLKRDNIRLAYWFIDPDNSLLNEKALEIGGEIVDEKVTYYRSILLEDVFQRVDEVIDFNKTKIPPKIYEIAIHASDFSRFRIDKNFKNQEYLILYNHWVKNSINRTIATDVLVYYEEGLELGLLTLKIENDRGIIGLLSVDEKHRGKSIGKKIINSAFFKMKENNVQEVIVTTQKANHSACRFYESMGFHLKSIVNVYHIWL